MTFRRGTTLPIATTLGHSESCDLGPTAGNGFFTRWPDDIALLSEAGITDVRITFDWSRFQPKPGEFAGDWVERYDNFVGAARAIDINVWATLYDSGVPKWFANEGGIDDAEALGRWWPRWAERVADRFGDQIDGWIPFAVNPTDLPEQVWVDTWGVLSGGSAPVALSVSGEDLDKRVSLPLSSADIVGVALSTTVESDAELNDDELMMAGERWESTLEQVISLASSKPVIVSQFSPIHDDDDMSGQLVSRLVEILDPIDECDVCFIDPSIGGVESPSALFDQDRAALPGIAAYTLIEAPES